MELITTFTTQLSTFHSYLEQVSKHPVSLMTITDMHTHKCTYTQRCKCYPIDASSGLHISIINQKVLLLVVVVVVVVVYLISSLAIDLIHTFT